MMDVRVLICWHPGNIYHASITTLGFTRLWYKFYPTKQECVTHLAHLGLLTIMDQDDVLKSNFDTEDRILTTETSTEADLLDAAGFIEITPSKLN